MRPSLRPIKYAAVNDTNVQMIKKAKLVVTVFDCKVVFVCQVLAGLPESERCCKPQFKVFVAFCLLNDRGNWYIEIAENLH